jgi:HTH-type transcriptional regulator/antitoxin HipB
MLKYTKAYQMIQENIDITQAIKAAREARGLSQRALGARIGVPQSHISKIESGSVDIQLSSLIQLARALDLEVQLVPRKSLSAVASVIRATEQRNARAHGQEGAHPAYSLEEDDDA